MSIPNEEKDSESNGHMPHFLIKSPWYVNQSEGKKKSIGTSNSKITINESRKRYLSENVVFKYRKGACENCGALTHKKKDCCERPRRRGAKYTKNNFKPDEFLEEINYDFEGKRDRWNGYEPSMEIRRIQEFEKFQELRKKIRMEKIKNNNLCESEKKKF